MDGSAGGINLAIEPDFVMAGLSVSPSACRIIGGGRELRVEAKTMAVFVVLARALGGTVTRDDLIAACWDGRVVSDDAIARTIAKVRSLARMVTPAPFTLETVPKVGYRLVEAGAVSQVAAAPAESGTATPAPPYLSAIDRRFLEFAHRWLPVALVIAAVALAPMLWAAATRDNGYNAAPPRSPEVMDALMNLDQQRLAVYLERGWDPNWKLDTEGNAALHQVMMVCERNQTGHDKPAMLRVVRFLVDSGADWTTSNGWGDTPLEIASARRYCGPDHPVVAYLSELAKKTPAHLIAVPHTIPEER